MRYVRTMKDLAAEADISVPLVCEYKKKGAPVKKHKGRGYLLEPFLRWMQANHLPRRKYQGSFGREVRSEEVCFPAGDGAGETGEYGNGDGVQTTGEAARVLNLQELARERKAKATIREIELKKLKGTLVPIEKIKERDLARIAMVKRGLLSFADSLPQHLEGLSAKEMRGIIHHRVRALLEKFANA